MLPAIKAEIIPHGTQRYPTVGDYWYKSEYRLEVRVSDMDNEDYEFLVLIHELIESHLCRRRGIPEPLIADFDRAYEEARKPGDISEPGNDPRCPCHKEHLFATKVEMTLAQEMGINWNEYSKVVDAL